MTSSPAPHRRRFLFAGLLAMSAAVTIGGLMFAGRFEFCEDPVPQGLPPELQPQMPPEIQPEIPPQPQIRETKSGEATRFTEQRWRMVQRDLSGRDIYDKRVLRAMGRVARHRFVSQGLEGSAYGDYPLPIGRGQTISQPYIVALMTQLVRPEPGCRALDVGTGSGYQAAVLGELCKEVYSIEIVESLAQQAKSRLAELGYENVTVRCGNGYRGWPQRAPFDVIVVAAAPDHVPQPLLDQLAPGGRLVIPVGRWYQDLLLIEKGEDGTIHRRAVAPVAFVPMTGEAEDRGK